MSSRVIGRGRCPRCGCEGSVVLKQLSGNVYVYVKHGRRWCYLGPLDAVPLSEILTSLELPPYHAFTTKFAGLAQALLGSSVRTAVGLLVLVCLLMPGIALGLCGPGYAAVSFVLILVSGPLLAFFVAFYEAEGRPAPCACLLSRLGLPAYTLLAALASLALLILACALRCPIALLAKLPSASPTPEAHGGGSAEGFFEVRVPLTAIWLTAMALFMFSRPAVAGRPLSWTVGWLAGTAALCSLGLGALFALFARVSFCSALLLFVGMLWLGIWLAALFLSALSSAFRALMRSQTGSGARR